MQKVQILDNNFKHIPYFAERDQTTSMQWERNLKNNDLIVFTDRYFPYSRSVDCKIKIAWLLEPIAIDYQSYSYLYQNGNDFTYIWTYDDNLLKRFSHAKPYYGVGSWLWKKDMKIYEKNKLISIIASNKNHADGHKMRHEVIQRFKNKITFICGRGYKPLDYTLDALKDYKYSIAIENSIQETYFTEKLMDCFLSGTIPIYRGSKNIGNIFNTNGFHTFTTSDELEHILNRIGDQDYMDKKDFIQENFNTALKYINMEDFLYETYIKDLL
jgi:hypothetical protein